MRKKRRSSLRSKILAGRVDILPAGIKPPHTQVVVHTQRGGYLRIVSKEDGSMAQELKLDGVPVSDGISVANGELFISLKNGVVCCYGK